MTEIKFAGIVDQSTLDFPGENAAVVYLCGCPFRCPWCQNPELVEETGNCAKTDLDYIIDQLKQNYLISGVTITGGEPLMQKETLELLKRIKEETDLKVKLDSNCFFPETLSKVLEYLDGFTTDVKAPLDERYGRVVGLHDQWKKIVERVNKSHTLLGSWPKFKEARTTIVPGLIDSEKDVTDAAEAVKNMGAEMYTLQQFRSDRTLDPGYKDIESPSVEKMLALGKVAKDHLPDVKVQIVTRKNGLQEIG